MSLILGESGAEKLVGNGDMLFYQTGYFAPKHVQGAYVSDQEIKRVIQYIKK